MGLATFDIKYMSQVRVTEFAKGRWDGLCGALDVVKSLGPVEVRAVLEGAVDDAFYNWVAEVERLKSLPSNTERGEDVKEIVH